MLQEAAQAAVEQTQTVSYLASASTVYFIQKMAKALPAYQRFVDAFPGADKWANWIFAAILSLFAATGIHIIWKCPGCSAWDPVAGGTGQILIPGIFVILHGLSDWFKVYILQQSIYEMSNRRTPDAAPRR